MNGKTIKIFLAEGEPNGVLTAEIMNWTGKMMVTPRSKLSQLAKREEAKRAGKVSASPGYRLLREQLRQEGKLQEDERGKFLVFTEDVPFTSPSAAASVVNGNNLSGPLSWKIEDSNKTYRQWQEDKLEKMESEGSTESS